MTPRRRKSKLCLPAVSGMQRPAGTKIKHLQLGDRQPAQELSEDKGDSAAGGRQPVTELLPHGRQGELDAGILCGLFPRGMRGVSSVQAVVRC